MYPKEYDPLERETERLYNQITYYLLVCVYAIYVQVASGQMEVWKPLKLELQKLAQYGWCGPDSGPLKVQQLPLTAEPSF